MHDSPASSDRSCKRTGLVITAADRRPLWSVASSRGRIPWPTDRIPLRLRCVWSWTTPSRGCIRTSSAVPSDRSLGSFVPSTRLKGRRRASAYRLFRQGTTGRLRSRCGGTTGDDALRRMHRTKFHCTFSGPDCPHPHRGPDRVTGHREAPDLGQGASAPDRQIPGTAHTRPHPSLARPPIAPETVDRIAAFLPADKGRPTASVNGPHRPATGRCQPIREHGIPEI